ncbi:MAG TPA: sigma-70 family RNA polymerase sigma factor [Allosphingosinicella sp.]|nr:sigma-70 family RNA polymerase sigma factor [Allosphingosinicella sp.]
MSRPTAADRLFESERPRLRGLAYRMLGSVSDAEDAVQDAWLRWNRIETGELAEPRAWLVRVVTRICIDRLRSARARREEYVGPWLPEPIVESEQLLDPAPSAALERADDLTVAFLLALERLSPLERAVFVLHDVFSTDYAELAAMLGKSEAACRQLAARARGHIEAAKPRYKVAEAQAKRLAAAFIAAVQSDDAERLGAMLAEDAVLVSDGGGKVPAALRPLLGRDRIVKFLLGVTRKFGRTGPADVRLARINGQPGLVLNAGNGLTTFSLEPDEQGRIGAVYVVRNPDKLRHVAAGPGAEGVAAGA